MAIIAIFPLRAICPPPCLIKDSETPAWLGLKKFVVVNGWVVQSNFSVELEFQADQQQNQQYQQ